MINAFGVDDGRIHKGDVASLGAVDDVVMAPARMTRSAAGQNGATVPPQGQVASKQKQRLRGNITAVVNGEGPVGKAHRVRGKFVGQGSKVVRQPAKMQRRRDGKLSRLDTGKDPRTQSEGVEKAYGGFVAPSQISKAYDRGTITLHQQQADLHSRKKQSGKRQASGGLAVAGVGATAALHPEVGNTVGRTVHDAVRPGLRREHGDFLGGQKAQQAARTATRATRTGGKLAAIGGAAVAGVGAARAVGHGHRQNREVQAAQNARRARNASIAKMVGDSTSQRGGVSANYTPPEAGKKPDIAAIKRALQPAKEAVVMSALKK